MFLYCEVLAIDLPWLDVRTARPEKAHSQRSDPARGGRSVSTPYVMGSAGSLYGTGMRLMEGLRLRIKDVDFDRRVIIVRDGKGGKDRVRALPQSLAAALQLQWRRRARGLECGNRAHSAAALRRCMPSNRNTPGRQDLGLFWLFSAHAIHRPAHRRREAAPSV